MALNIKNPEVHAVAAELAKLRRVSVTQAVLEAVRRELTREKGRRKREKLGDELIAIGQRCAAHLGRRATTADPAAFLYDSRGLPR